MASKLVDRRIATAQSTTTGNNDILTYGLPDASVSLVKAVVVARRPSNGDSAAWEVAAGVKRHGGGGATLISTVASLVAKLDSGAATWTATLVVSGNNIIVRTTGQASATIEWQVDVEVHTYVP